MAAIDSLRRALGADVPAGDAAARALDEITRSARAAWPEVEVGDDRFAAFVGERLAGGRAAGSDDGDDALAATLRALPAADLYLACACTDGTAGAHVAFDGLLGEVDAAAVGMRASPDVIDEVKQLLRTQLLVVRDDRPPGIAGFAGRGSLRAWLRITATRELVRQLKKQLRDVPLEQAILETPGDGDPILERLKARYRAEFASALGDAIADLGPRERTLLRLQVLDRLAIDGIGAIYGVHRATAARWLIKARSELVAATRARLAERLRLEVDEVTSVIRLIQSRLDASVERLLDEADPGADDDDAPPQR
jgi:RNA polymerase sigma-70 factor, ECF subfamily